ncbi:MAG TPA: PKD domain-containing protein [Candidatus Polarisedimenticolia bacterium]|nr:PKD domain-containing protein [Candidatus Polarisedimenticolia bacterium]
MRRNPPHLLVPIVSLVTAGFLTGSLPANAQTVRLPSRFVPGDVAITAAAMYQVAPFLSQGGSAVLAVWADNRANSTGGYEGETSWDIYGMRLDGAGNPLEAVPFAVTAGRASQHNPRAAWNGTNWLVVYESNDISGTGSFRQDSLEAVRVAPDGHVLDAKPIKIFNMTPVGGTWAVASDGSQWVVVNQGTSSTGDLVAARISSAGVLQDPGPRSLVPGTYYLRGGLHLAFAGGVFLLAYEESMTGHDPTNVIRFNSSLTLLDAAPYSLAGAPLGRLVSNGASFYAVWNEQLPDYTMSVKGSRIGTNGQKLDGGGVNISGPNGPSGYAVTSVAWDGTTWKVTWGAVDGTRLARVNAAGQVLDPGGVLVAGASTGLSASAGNGTVQLVRSEFVTNDSDYDVFTGHIDSANVAGPERTLSIGAPSQSRPEVATSGSGYMMVYRSSTAAGNRVLAQPLDATGNPRTAEPVELDSANGINYPGYPAVAWNGSVYMAAWNNGSGVVVRRVRQDGTLVDPTPILVMVGFGPVDIAALGGDFLVAGLRCGINCQYVFPIAARVRGGDGVVLDAAPLQFNGIFSSNVRLAALGGRWLLVWQSNASHDNCSAYTNGAFVDAAGGQAPEFTIHGPYSSCGGNGIFTIGLAASNNVALMVQSQELTSGVENDLLGRLIDPDGTVHPYFNLTPWSDDQYRPRIAWDGSYFVVVWQDQRTALGIGPWRLEEFDARSDLMGMRITEGGAILDPQGFVLSNSPVGEAYPNVVAANGVTLFAASLVRNNAPFANYRVGYELLGAGGNPWPSPSASAAPSDGDVPLSVSFSSAGTFDPGGAIAAYLWDFGDGSTSTATNPVHLYSVPGPFVATLTATDTAGASAVQEVLVKPTAPNLAPIAVATSDINHGPAPLDVRFYASGSYDPDGFIGNIRWEFSDGSGGTWGSPAFNTFYKPGTWQVTLTVGDARGATGTATLSITVGPPLLPAAPSNLFAIAFSPDWINMTWTDNSNSEDGFKVERCPGTGTFCAGSPGSWSQIAQVGPNINYYGDTGLPPTTTYSYRVRAFNVTGDSPYSNISTATTQTYPPVASNVPSVLNGPAPLAVTFDGRGSHDPDGTIVSWNWAFGDGATATGSLVSHTYTTTGWVYPSLTVTDNAGATNTAYASINVKDGSYRSPVTGDAGTTFGQIVSGSYFDTQTQNNVAEVLIEAQTAGTLQTRTSRLEHEWSLTVAAGGMQRFYLDAWHTPNSEGDDFTFEYSRDNVTWTPMITVTKTSDNSVLQSYTFPGDVTGQLWVRVRDLDRTAGHGQMDKVSIDEMFISSSLSTGYCGEAAAGGSSALLTLSTVAAGALRLDWGASCVGSDKDYAVYEGPMGDFTAHVPVVCSTGGATTATIAPSAGNMYYLIVPNDQVNEGRFGTSSSGVDISGGPTRCYPAALLSGCP